MGEVDPERQSLISDDIPEDVQNKTVEQLQEFQRYLN